MNLPERTAVIGVFEHFRQAEQAVRELKRLDIPDDRIGLLARAPDDPKQPTDLEAQETQWEVGMTTGSIAGGAAGSLLGLAIVAGLLPGIGPVLAGGVLGSVLATAVAGATAGGVLGMLVGFGVPKDEAAYYEHEVRSGRTVVIVQADGHAAQINAVLRQFGAYDIGTPREPAGV